MVVAGRAVNASCLLAIGVLMTCALRPTWSRERVLALGFGVGALGLTLEPMRSTFALGQVNLILLVLLLADLLGRTPSLGARDVVGGGHGLRIPLAGTESRRPRVPPARLRPASREGVRRPRRDHDPARGIRSE
ncbi:glycosyltransferase 87 family protein [Kribbella sp. VKM Ac-2571]|uniref:glycosyltransferase 87 family protein n=1 Tax=Kribbella sp. VKM Ac-2571 TaxID=2512222 RepID=UPI001414F57A